MFILRTRENVVLIPHQGNFSLQADLSKKTQPIKMSCEAQSQWIHLQNNSLALGFRVSAEESQKHIL